MQTTQLERVKQMFMDKGFVSRNELLDVPFNKITRLSSIIERLRKNGMEIITEITDRDTIYKHKPSTLFS